MNRDVHTSATGGTGRLIVRDALAKGHSVVALVRSKARTLGSISVLRATGCVYCTPWALILLAEAYAKLGRPAEGLTCLGEAAQIIETTDEMWEEAELYRLRGDLLNVTADRAAAVQSYRQALGVAQRQRVKVFELRAVTGLARLWRDQGKRDAAREVAILLVRRREGVRHRAFRRRARAEGFLGVAANRQDRPELPFGRG